MTVTFQSARRVLVLAAALLAGCGSNAPKTYPVQGKIVLAGQGGGLRQLAGGKVRVVSAADVSVTGVGEIEDDGSFSLGTYHGEQALPGLPAGRYKARIEPPRAAADDDDRPARLSLPAKYRDYDTSGFAFEVPPAGEVVLEVRR